MPEVVIAPLGSGNSIAPEDFADLTPVPVLDVGFNWNGLLKVTFDSETPFEVPLRRAIRRRIMRTSPENELLRGNIAETQATIEGWDPDQVLTTAQLTTRLNVLARQVKALANLNL
jgi:hypothetical protein